MKLFNKPKPRLLGDIVPRGKMGELTNRRNRIFFLVSSLIDYGMVTVTQMSRFSVEVEVNGQTNRYLDE